MKMGIELLEFSFSTILLDSSDAEQESSGVLQHHHMRTAPQYALVTFWQSRKSWNNSFQQKTRS